MHLLVVALLISNLPTGSYSRPAHQIELRDSFISQPSPAAPRPDPVHTAAADRTDIPDTQARNEQQTGQHSETAPADVQETIMSSPLGLGMAHGYFSSLGEGKTLRDDIRSYYFEIVEKINIVWWSKAKGLTETVRQDSIIEIAVGRDGTILHKRVINGSGSRIVDRALMEAISDAAPFPPIPDYFPNDVFLVPLKITVPSHLFNIHTQKK